MTPQYLAGLYVHCKELTQVASRLRMFKVLTLDRPDPAFTKHLLHLAEGSSLAGQRHRDVQGVGLRAEGHRAPVLESGGARTHFELHANLRNLARLVGNFAGLRTHFQDVLVAEIGGVNERSV